MSENVGILGNSQKQRIDVRKYYFDFKRWLDIGDTISRLSNFSALPAQGGWGWQIDYPFAMVTEDVSDSYPLLLNEADILSGKIVSLMVTSGTPGISYLVSFLATAVTGRAKQIDLVVEVTPPPVTTPAPEVPDMPPSPPNLIIYETTVMPAGTSGVIYVSNVSGGPITVTLPPSPVLGQNLLIKDISGTASVHPITVSGGTSTIEEQPTLVMNFNYNWVQLTFTGAQWVQV